MNTKTVLVLALRAISTLLPATQQSTTPCLHSGKRIHMIQYGGGVLICWSSRPQHSLGVRLTRAYILHRRLSPELVRRPDTHNRNALVKLRPQPHLKCRCKLRIQYMIAHSSGQSGWEVGVSGLGCSTRMSKGHSLSSLIGSTCGKESFVQGTRDNKQAHIHCVQHLWSFHNGIMAFHDVKHEQVPT